MFSLSFLTSLCFFDANLRIIGQTAGSAHSFFPPAVQEKFCRKKKAAYICSAQSPDGGIGRRTGLKIQRPQGCAGSTPAPGTSLSKALQSSCEAFLLFSSLHLPFPPGTIPHRLFPTSPPNSASSDTKPGTPPTALSEISSPLPAFLIRLNTKKSRRPFQAAG